MQFNIPLTSPQASHTANELPNSLPEQLQNISSHVTADPGSFLTDSLNLSPSETQQQHIEQLFDKVAEIQQRSDIPQQDWQNLAEEAIAYRTGDGNIEELEAAIGNVVAQANLTPNEAAQITTHLEAIKNEFLANNPDFPAEASWDDLIAGGFGREFDEILPDASTVMDAIDNFTGQIPQMSNGELPETPSIGELFDGGGLDHNSLPRLSDIASELGF